MRLNVRTATTNDSGLEFRFRIAAMKEEVAESMMNANATPSVDSRVRITSSSVAPHVINILDESMLIQLMPFYCACLARQ